MVVPVVADAPRPDPDDDRVDCTRCAHLASEPAVIKLPPADPHLDPRTSHRELQGERDSCLKGNFPLPGRLRRCGDFASARGNGGGRA